MPELDSATPRRSSQEEWLTDTQLAEEWQLRPKTLRNWRSRKVGPPYTKINGRVRYSRSAIDLYAASNTVTPETGAA